MLIKICGPGCANCEKTGQIVEAAGAAIEKLMDFQEMAMMGVFSTPVVVINGEMKCVGRIPKQEEVEQWLD